MSLVVVCLAASCSPVKELMISNGDQDSAVQNAITDFLASGDLNKKDNVFSLQISNINDNILGISVLGTNNKLYPTPENQIGTNTKYFPTRFLERNKKLFYWYDSTSVITEDLIKALSKYHQIDSLNVHGIVGIPESHIDDSKKGMDYYFCRCNLSIYKKVKTRTAMGWYNPPQVECGKNK